MGQINAENLTQDEVRAILDEIKADYQRQRELEEMELASGDDRIELREIEEDRYYTIDERIELAKQKKRSMDDF